MPNFNSDVVIEAHDLRLVDANGDEVARLDQDGNLVVRREFAGALRTLSVAIVGLLQGEDDRDEPPTPRSSATSSASAKSRQHSPVATMTRQRPFRVGT
jgi:hypothetical protein